MALHCGFCWNHSSRGKVMLMTSHPRYAAIRKQMMAVMYLAILFIFCLFGVCVGLEVKVVNFGLVFRIHLG